MFSFINNITAVFLVLFIKTLDPDPYPDSLDMLDPDPYSVPDLMNPDVLYANTS